MSEETAVYQVAKKSSMNDKTRAINYYAAAVILFQDPSEEDCGIVIGLLEKALNLYSDLDFRVFIEDVWHYLLKSLDPGGALGTYEKYLGSPAWNRKRDLVIERDKGICVRCRAEGKEVHHKTYDNIGKESLSDLVMLCEKCHEKEHQPRVPFDHQPAIQQPLDPLKEAFIAYVDRESDILQLVDSGRSRHPDYVNYESDYPTKDQFPDIYLSAWMPAKYNDIAAVISMRADSKYYESHYKRFEEHKGRIEDAFSFEEVKLRSSKDRKMYHLRVVKKGVDLTQTADRDTAFRWLRENLEKLYWVLRVPDTLDWDNT